MIPIGINSHSSIKMSSFALVILILQLLPCVFTSEVKVTNGNCSYSWKDFEGDIPDDAIEGGSDSNGEIFYVGMVYLKLINELFAGMIMSGSQSARITSLGVTREVRNDPFTVVQILTSPDADAFEWVMTTSEDLHLVPDLVGGGKVLGQDLYIGRVRQDGGFVVGKVFPHKFIYQGLYVPAGKSVSHFLKYKVLTFNCQNKLAKAREREEVAFDIRISNFSDSLRR